MDRGPSAAAPELFLLTAKVPRALRWCLLLLLFALPSCRRVGIRCGLDRGDQLISCGVADPVADSPHIAEGHLDPEFGIQSTRSAWDAQEHSRQHCRSRKSLRVGRGGLGDGGARVGVQRHRDPVPRRPGGLPQEGELRLAKVLTFSRHPGVVAPQDVGDAA